MKGVTVLGILVMLLPGCGRLIDILVPDVELSFDFSEGMQGWTAGISDYGIDQLDDLQFIAAIRPLPEELDDSGDGLYVQSFNTPDDLFTYITRRVGPEDGIEPNRAYVVSYTIRFASNAPSDCVGVGGAPGESVYLKAGAADEAPAAVEDEDGYVSLNLDKGQQAEGGDAASVTGDIANGEECADYDDLEDVPYVTIIREHTHDTVVTSTADGELWLIVGVESGYESLTALYYQRIDVELRAVTP